MFLLKALPSTLEPCAKAFGNPMIWPHPRFVTTAMEEDRDFRLWVDGLGWQWSGRTVWLLGDDTRREAPSTDAGLLADFAQL